MEQLRLVGVHDDGEHLIVETPDSTRYRLKIDQQLRQTIQHARRKPPARGRGGASYGPRDIQARFRAGASVEDVVAESGWEAERVKRYEWPILAERSHMVEEACRVTVSGTGPAHDGYRSVFEGEPKTLHELVDERAPRLGVDRSSFDWDAWLREDQLWSVQLSFTVSDPGAAGLDTDGPALWSYNHTTRSLRPENAWAHALGEEPRESGPLGAPAPALPAAAPAAPVRALQHETGEADELLDVLQARRGRRLGSDEAEDDRLAEILGRGMGRVEQRPRPIDAPQDSPVFDRPIQPAASQVAEEQALRGEGIEIVDDSTPDHGRQRGEPADDHAPGSTRDTPREAHTDGTTTWVDVTEESPQESSPGEDRDPGSDGTPAASGTAPSDVVRPIALPAAATDTDTADVPREDETGAQPSADTGVAEEQDSDQSAPGPRARTPKAKRSSVPSWDDIVFGANRP
ncbi:septation protein SepH [Kocuria tytonis]|uniref:DUF3071 domain-containing protein n=1 Tax=Kocuria tytonis TaxID=2054280 RepID=A0A495AA13_9MICC|nr:septation protein SepH [Kocuria tytonis]RKQ36280.1 DUF3071 domain-containing protein [Kocuria tytonis]